MGTDLLREYLQARGIPGSVVARACGFRRYGVVLGWTTGRCRPTPVRRVRLFEVTGIDPELWDLPSTKKTTEN